MAARVVGIRQEGVNPCRMVPSMKGRGTRQLHDVTGKVQHARLIIAAQRRELRVAALDAHCKFNNGLIRNEGKQASLSSEQDFPGQG